MSPHREKQKNPSPQTSHAALGRPGSPVLLVAFTHRWPASRTPQPGQLPSAECHHGLGGDVLAVCFLQTWQRLSCKASCWIAVCYLCPATSQLLQGLVRRLPSDWAQLAPSPCPTCVQTQQVASAVQRTVTMNCVTRNSPEHTIIYIYILPESKFLAHVLLRDYGKRGTNIFMEGPENGFKS